MLHAPWYDPSKDYETNFVSGPSGDFTQATFEEGEASYDFFGKPLLFPFGIPAGPLLNSDYVVPALDRRFDVTVYKTVRTHAYPAHPHPNVVPVSVEDDLTLERASQGVLVRDTFSEPLSITNSFGVPSKDPSFWQEDMRKAVEHARPGQHVVGSFQGTKWPGASSDDYIQDWVTASKLVQETGVSAIEADLSCPNEDSTNLLCYDLEKTRLISEKIKNAIGNLPLIAKIGYFGDEELREFVKLLGGTLDGIAAVNAIAADVRDSSGNQALPGKGRLKSGICGASIKWAGLSMTRRLFALRQEMGHSYTIIGVGGVTAPKDYKEYRASGADVVMSATGAMWNQNLAREIQNHE